VPHHVRLLGEVVGLMNADATFTMTCAGAGGTTVENVTVTVTTPPSVPTVSLNTNSSSVASGESSVLDWTVTNATSCTASGGWSGSKNATSGSENTGALTTETTFTLSCTGTGGTTADSVTVTVALFTRTLSWSTNTESDLAGYKIYYGTASRGCDISALDEQFVYSGSQADQGASPIVIFLADLDDHESPEYLLTNLQLDTDYTFATTAFNQAGDESIYSREVAVDDSFAPILCDASAATSTKIILDYSESIEETSSENMANYVLIDGSNSVIPISSIVYDDVTSKNVTLTTTNALVEGMVYTLTVNGVSDLFANAMNSDTNVFTYTDSPSIKNVSKINHGDGIKVTYSENVTNSSASLASNYSLDDPLNIAHVSVEDERNVLIYTDTALVEGDTYTATINNIMDLFDNIIPFNSTSNFTQPFDTEVPRVLSAHITNPSNDNSKVYVVFNENMDAISANNHNNYAIDSGISITDAALQSDGRTVILTTNTHPDGDYTIVVSDITDNSTAANFIAITELSYRVVTSN